MKDTLHTMIAVQIQLQLQEISLPNCDNLKSKNFIDVLLVQNEHLVSYHMHSNLFCVVPPAHAGSSLADFLP
jgi:hypothetical protein